MSRRRQPPRKQGVVAILHLKERCKVCGGKGGDCPFCVKGHARLGCADCRELLPLCACFDRGGYRARVAQAGAR